MADRFRGARAVAAVTTACAVMTYLGCAERPGGNSTPQVVPSINSTIEDHSGHNHGPGEDHSGHDHGPGEDHSGHDHGPGEDHSGHDHGTAEQPKAADSASAKPSGPAPFTGWEAPAATLLISGQMNGYLEPCGCSLGQTGGLGRRFDLVEQLRSKGWNPVAVDLGSIAEDPASARGGPEQSKIKFSIALRALKQMGYAGIGFSADDLKLGLGDFFGQYMNVEGAPTILAANVTPPEGLETFIVPTKVIEAGPIRVGLTSVIDPQLIEQLRDPEKDVFVRGVTPAREAAEKALASLEGQSAMQVLLVQGPPELAKELALAVPGFEVVVATSKFPAPPDQPESLNDGKTHLVTVGKKGQYVGVLGLYPDKSGGAPKLAYQRIVLDDRYGYADAMKTLIGSDYTREMQQAGVLVNFPRIALPADTFYVGAETCKSCHEATYNAWSKTGHSHAYRGLLEGIRGNREMDAECVSCHTTGFGYNSGYVDLATTPALKGNQCENCHGPGSKHSSDPDNPEFLDAMVVTKDQANSRGLCVKCHDEDNDPDYDFAKLWPKVAHPALDSYDDPKFHKGIDLEALRKATAAPAPAAE